MTQPDPDALKEYRRSATHADFIDRTGKIIGSAHYVADGVDKEQAKQALAIARRAFNAIVKNQAPHLKHVCLVASAAEEEMPLYDSLDAIVTEQGVRIHGTSGKRLTPEEGMEVARILSDAFQRPIHATYEPASKMGNCDLQPISLKDLMTHRIQKKPASRTESTTEWAETVPQKSTPAEQKLANVSVSKDTEWARDILKNGFGKSRSSDTYLG